jgi:hypothetical protein
MDINRIPKQAYDLLVNLDNRGKRNWVTELKSLLFRSGFGFVWMDQGVTNEKQFCVVFKQRLMDMSIQTWSNKLRSSERFGLYCGFKIDFCTEKYLDCIQQKCFRDALVRMRFGISNLTTHKNRYVRPELVPNNDCPFCPGREETELHVFFVCPKYQSLRPNMWKNIDPAHQRNRFMQLMSSQAEKQIRQVAWFCFKCKEARELVNV